MANPSIAAIIDALFCIPRREIGVQVAECVPFNLDLTHDMNLNGIAGAVIAPCNCAQCPHQWSCGERKTNEIVGTVAKNPKRLRGLAIYDPLRIGESLRRIDEAFANGELAGAYTQAECGVSGLDTRRMYPLYGFCAKLRSPVVMHFTNRERWVHHRPQVEVVAADFPELDILLAAPPGTDAAGSILPLIQRYPNISFLLCPQELQSDAALWDYVETQGSEHALFCSSFDGWPAAVETALALPLSLAARQAYLFDNAARLFRFPVEVPIPKA